MNIIEPEIHKNNYYDNYHQNYNKHDDLSINNTALTNILIILKLVAYTINLREIFHKIFNPDKFLIYIFSSIKDILKEYFPFTNKIFKDKNSSLTLNYIHFTSSYYISQNNDSDYYCYKSILEYTILKKIRDVKYLLNQEGDIIYFDVNEDIPIYDNIFINTKTTITSNS